MKTQSLSHNALVYLQSQPRETQEFQDSFELLHIYLRRTVNLLGKRLAELTINQGDLTEIGKAQRALSGALRDFHKVLATLGDLQILDPYQLQDPTEPEAYADADPNPEPTHQAPRQCQSAPEPHNQPEPRNDPEPHNEPEPKPESQPTTPPPSLNSPAPSPTSNPPPPETQSTPPIPFPLSPQPHKNSPDSPKSLDEINACLDQIQARLSASK